MEAVDGQTTRTGTGPGWLAAGGPVLAADLQLGQVSDFQQGSPDWCRPGGPSGPSGRWTPAVGRELGVCHLTSSAAPPVRRVEEIVPRAVRRPRPDRQVVDLGQNINGWVRLSRLGPSGTEPWT